MQITGEQLAFFYFSVGFSCVLLWMPAWLLLSIFTPKILLDKYFREPHFTLTETVMMAQFPGFLIRTAIFAWLIIFPKLGRKKRQIWKVKNYMPRWYHMALVSLTLYMLFALAVIVLIPLTLYMFYP